MSPKGGRLFGTGLGGFFPNGAPQGSGGGGQRRLRGEIRRGARAGSLPRHRVEETPRRRVWERAREGVHRGSFQRRNKRRPPWETQGRGGANVSPKLAALRMFRCDECGIRRATISEKDEDGKDQAGSGRLRTPL